MTLQELIKEAIEHEAEKDFDASVTHGVHMECQTDVVFYTAQCGALCAANELVHDFEKPECPICWMPSAFCIVCGEAIK